ncbi:hypothetical protein KKG31_06065 [Patescibacteria group bacterium]|nr:hypothetical protein [Patescibacteria group bacterium]MBU1758665.1 hypothetical protein [Patescibacteria group bacterium]
MQHNYRNPKQTKGVFLLYTTLEGKTGVKVKPATGRDFLSLNQIKDLFEGEKTYTVRYS